MTSVAKERLKSPRARLFVALDLPEDVRDGLAAWQRDQVTAEELRPARPETLHMTLAFLGYHPEKEIDRVAEAATAGLESAAPEVRLLPEPVGVPRGRSRPGLFAIEAESPGAVELQAEVESKLVAARLYEPEKRDFWPHLTVARVRSERQAQASGGRAPPRQADARRDASRAASRRTPAALFLCPSRSLPFVAPAVGRGVRVHGHTLSCRSPAAERQVEDGKAPDPP